MSVKEKFLAAVNVIESLPSDGKKISMLCKNIYIMLSKNILYCVILLLKFL